MPMDGMNIVPLRRPVRQRHKKEKCTVIRMDMLPDERRTGSNARPVSRRRPRSPHARIAITPRQIGHRSITIGGIQSAAYFHDGSRYRYALGGIRHAILRLGKESWLHPVHADDNPHGLADSPMPGHGRLDHLGLAAATPEAFRAMRWSRSAPAAAASRIWAHSTLSGSKTPTACAVSSY